MKFLKTAALAAGAIAMMGTSALAQTTNLRIQTHYAPNIHQCYFHAVLVGQCHQLGRLPIIGCRLSH